MVYGYELGPGEGAAAACVVRRTGGVLLGSARGLDTPPARDPRRVHLVVDERVTVSKVPQGAYHTASELLLGILVSLAPGMVALTWAAGQT